MEEATHFRFRGAVSAATGFVLAVSVAATPLYGADEIELGIDGGRVTLVATDAPLADILAAWSRAGDTRFIGAEPIGGERVTLHLTEVPEAQAIRLVLRNAAGYVAAPRRAGNPGRSRYDRVTILAARTTRDPASAPVAAPRALAGDVAGMGGAAPSGLLPIEDLQRLLDAAAGRPARTQSDAEPPPRIPVLTTPFPGMGAFEDPSRTSGAGGRNRRTP